MEIRLLGTVETIVDGIPVNLGPRRQRLVLAVLALEANRLVSVDRLVELSWPTAPPRTAVHAIRVSASRLRCVLAEAGATEHNVELFGNGYGYVLRTDTKRVDAHRFRSLVERARDAPDEEGKAMLIRQALGLWRGLALTGIGPAETREGLARGLEEARLVALEDRTEAEMRMGRHRELLDELTELVEAHPLRERLTALLMIALYRSGQTAAALAAFRRTRQRLAEDLGIDPCAELRDLEVALLRSDAALAPPMLTRPSGPPTGATLGSGTAGDACTDGFPVFPPIAQCACAVSHPRADLGAIVAGHPVTPALRPAQLPPAAGDFTGRAAEMLELREMTDQREPTAQSTLIIVITGPAGVGKTALAVQLAQQLRGLFGDGQLFVDLHGYAHVPPLDPSVALGRFLRALGVAPNEAPSDPEEAAALYRTLLDEKQALIFLDNAATAEQVRLLLPAAPQCLALVTSRDSLTGLVALNGARCLCLDVLEADEARALLGKIAGKHRIAAEPGALDRLALMCGHLPLALRIAAANLARHPHQSIGEYAAELERGCLLTALEAGGDGQAALRTAFELSYLTVDRDARELFRLLGLVPDLGITASIAELLIGGAPWRGRELLDQLARAHLIKEHAAGEFAMDELIRIYANERAQAEDSAQKRESAVLRLLQSRSAMADQSVRHDPRIIVATLSPRPDLTS
jgi:DNA-binding SARP family transcriptional activator